MRALWVHRWIEQRRQRQARWQHSPERRILQAGRVLALLISLLATLGMFALALAYASLTADLPPIEQLALNFEGRDAPLLQPTRIYDRSGNHLLATLDGGVPVRRLRPIDPQAPDALNPLLVQGTVALFQPDFWQSRGFVFSLDAHPHTLAERLVNDLLLWNEAPGLRRTLRMRLLAWQAVARYGHTQVLTWFLNSARFGPQTYGAEQAALRYLGKPATALNAAEVALLLATLESPGLNPLDTPDVALERQRQVLDRMLGNGVIDLPTYQEANASRLELHPPDNAITSSATFLHTTLAALGNAFNGEWLERGGLRLVTTLDYDLQQQVVCTLQAYLEAVNSGGVSRHRDDCPAARFLPSLPDTALPSSGSTGLAGGALVMDVESGQVLAWAEVDAQGNTMAFAARRPTGTLLSPFLALAAFARGMSPATLVWDVPQEGSTASATGRGPERLRLALIGDDRAALMHLLEQIGPQTVLQNLAALGLPLPESAAGSLLSDSPNLTLAEIAQIYRPLATLGLGSAMPNWPTSQPIGILRMESSNGQIWLNESQAQVRPLISAQLAYLVHHVLSDEGTRWARLGYPNLLDIGRPVAAKLGQVQDGQTTWVVGYSRQRLVAVWIAREQTSAGDPLNPQLAAGLWHGLMQYLHQDLPVADWNPPPGIVFLDVCDPSGLLPTAACPQVVREVFLSENQPTRYDTLYRTFQVNRETGRLATAFTPPELVEERVYLVVPPEALPWAQQAGLPLPPTQYDNIPAVAPNPEVQISQPQPLDIVGGSVTIRGTADGQDFAGYRLQVGQGLNPRTWVTLANGGEQPVREGTLGTWDTRGLEEGVYILRLTVIRADQRIESALIQVTVDNTPPRVSLLTPTAGDAFILPGNGLIPLYAEAEDNYGIRRVLWRLDGREVAQTATTPYIWLWKGQRGEHTLEVIAEDLAGNRASSGIVPFKVR